MTSWDDFISKLKFLLNRLMKVRRNLWFSRTYLLFTDFKTSWVFRPKKLWLNDKRCFFLLGQIIFDRFFWPTGNYFFTWFVCNKSLLPCWSKWIQSKKLITSKVYLIDNYWLAAELWFVLYKSCLPVAQNRFSQKNFDHF